MSSDEDGMPRVVPIRKQKCPLCGKPTVDEVRPFCSRRCADLDLGAWLKESYRIPAEEEASFDDEFSGEE